MRFRKPAVFATLGMLAGAAAITALTVLPQQPALVPPEQTLSEAPPQVPAADGAVVTGPRSAGRLSGVPVPASKPGGDSQPVLTLAHTGPGSTASSGAFLDADRREVLTVQRGDTLMGLLVSAGIERTQAHASVEALRNVWDPRSLRPGDQITVTFALRNETGEAFHGLSFEPDPARRVLASRDDEGGFSATEVKAALRDETVRYEGKIESSLYVAATAEGVSPSALATLIQAFSYDVDFQRDIQPGDSFEVMVERQVNPAGVRVGDPQLTFASLTLSGKRLAIYRYVDSQGHADFYDGDGKSVRKALLRTPINGARLSSGYGTRKHPVLGYTKMHRGVDFAAPTGTPIFAAGDAVVEKAGTFGAYGNYVRLRHNATYDTAYAHLSRFGKGIKAGQRVRQGDVIGYVGSTGRSTGPHLHYEVLKKGAQVNPIGVTFPSGRELEGKELKRFAAAREEIRKTYAALPVGHTTADADSEAGTQSKASAWEASASKPSKTAKN